MKYNFDIDELKCQVAEVIKESQNFYNLNITANSIIDNWLEAKKFFIEKLDGNLVYESDEIVNFHLDEDSRLDRLHKFADLVCVHYQNESLSEFLFSLDINDFYKNKTSKEYNCFYDIKIPKNYKVIKAFKFFINDPKILEDVQNEASRLIQEDVVSGHLCFSVHPLDFLSASENVHNWRSCHALDGEYRSGNLNYLMDSATVICYLKGEKLVKLPHFPESVPWNSKKWRTWFFFSNDKSMLFAGRQYPFASDTGIDYVKDVILPKIGLGDWGPYIQKKVTKMVDKRSGTRFSFVPMLPIGNTLKPLRQLVQNGKYTYMYNDILSSNCYDPLYAYAKEDFDDIWWSSPTGKTNDKTSFVIGEKCVCPICNSENIAFNDIMACHGCMDAYQLGDNDDYCVCDICGTSVYQDDIISLDLSDMYVCPECYRRETYTCQSCGVTDLPDMIKYYHGLYLCPDCISAENSKPHRIFF